jgi:RNA polymerase sigma-70 factor (ECF subfamily)
VREVVVPLHRARPASEHLSEEALVAACAVGDSAALAALFDRLHPQLFRFVSRLIGSDGADVDDLVQATFLQVWRCAPTFRGNSAARTWILGVAANVGRRYVRSEGRRANATARLALSPSLRAADASEAAERRELVARVSRALERLPHPLREAFLLCDVEELSGVEAARALDVRPGTLWRRLHEARQCLRSALEEEGA